MDVGKFFGKSFPFCFCPDHEGVHWSSDAGLTPPWGGTDAVRGGISAAALFVLADIRPVDIGNPVQIETNPAVVVVVVVESAVGGDGGNHPIKVVEHLLR